MKLTHSRATFGNRRHHRSVIRTLNLGSMRRRVEAGKKIAIRWHEPEDWRVPIRGADKYEPAGI